MHESRANGKQATPRPQSERSREGLAQPQRLATAANHGTVALTLAEPRYVGPATTTHARYVQAPAWKLCSSSAANWRTRRTDRRRVVCAEGTETARISIHPPLSGTSASSETAHAAVRPRFNQRRDESVNEWQLDTLGM